MSEIPKDKALDNTLNFLADPYRFIGDRCRRYNSDIFETRLMLSKVICVSGEEATQMFYYPGRFTRKGAIPPTALMLLQDKGSVQTLDGAAHKHRKGLFMGFMNDQSTQKLVDLMVQEWREQQGRWTKSASIVLLPEAGGILCRAVCKWAGIDLSETEARQRTSEFMAMIDGAGAVGLRNLRGQLQRLNTERWAADVIERVRRGEISAPGDSVISAIATHRDLDGNLLKPNIAAVELINFLRPTVAVAWYITFAALALQEHPQCREAILSGGDEYAELFIQEVRRYYPFFPGVAGHVKNEFDWRGYHFSEGTWVMLDIYGTNHDERVWADADAFKPERFRTWNGSPFNFIPQGGGDTPTGHRCPGERITIELCKAAVQLLAGGMEYDVPPQDLTLHMSRMPAIPKSRFVINNVRITERVKTF